MGHVPETLRESESYLHPAAGLTRIGTVCAGPGCASQCPVNSETRTRASTRTSVRVVPDTAVLRGSVHLHPCPWASGPVTTRHPAARRLRPPRRVAPFRAARRSLPLLAMPSARPPAVPGPGGVTANARPRRRASLPFAFRVRNRRRVAGRDTTPHRAVRHRSQNPPGGRRWRGPAQGAGSGLWRGSQGDAGSGARRSG